MLDPEPQWNKGISVTQRVCHPSIYLLFHMLSFVFKAVFFLQHGHVLKMASKPAKEEFLLVLRGEEGFKNQRPSRSCRREAGPRCPLGSCRSYLCRLLMWPGRKTEESLTYIWILTMRFTTKQQLERKLDGVKLSAACTYIRDNRRRQCPLLQALPVKALKPSKGKTASRCRVMIMFYCTITLWREMNK